MLSRSVHSIFYFILGGKPLDSVSEEREEEKEAWVFFFWWEVWGQSMCRDLFVNCSFHCTGSFPFRKNNKIQAAEWNGNSSWMELCSSVVMDLGDKVTGWIRSGTVLPLVTSPLSWVYAKALLPKIGSVRSPLFRTFSLLAVYVDPAVSRDQLANHIKYPHSFSISSLLRQSAQLPSCVLLSASEMQSPCCQWTAARQASLSVTSSWVYPSSCPSSRWCHPTISSSVIPFSSRLQSFPASGSFPVSQFFASGGQSIAASASVLPMNTQDWSPLGWTGWISLQSKGLSRVFSNTTVQKHNLEKGMAHHFSVSALRTPWAGWKGEKVWQLTAKDAP